MSYPVIISHTLEWNPLENRDKTERTFSHHEKLDIEEAISHLKKKVKENCHLIDEYIELGRLYRKKGEYRRSYLVLRNLIIRDDLKKDQQARAHAEIGYNYLFSKIKDFGESHFSQSLKYNKDSTYALEGLYLSYRENKNFDRAIETLRTLVKQSPDRNPELVLLLTETAIQKLNAEEISSAKKFLDLAKDLGIDTPFLHLAIAKVQSMESKKKEAIATLEELIEKWPSSSAIALKKIETLYYELNQYSRFSYTLTKCLQKNPQNFYAHHELGKYLIKIRKPEEAIEHFEKAIQLCPFSLESLKEVIQFYKNKNDPEGVVKILDVFLSSLPDALALSCPRCGGKDSSKNCPVCSSTPTPKYESISY